MTPDEVAKICSCYGLPLIEQRVVANPEDAGAAAAEMGGTLALKAIAPGVLHKTEAGAVRLSVSGAEAVRIAAREMSSNRSPTITPYLSISSQRTAGTPKRWCFISCSLKH